MFNDGADKILAGELSREERSLMKWVGIFRVGIFRGGGSFPGGILMGGKDV